jgi:hypothetical protein
MKEEAFNSAVTSLPQESIPKSTTCVQQAGRVGKATREKSLRKDDTGGASIRESDPKGRRKVEGNARG